MMGQSVYLKQVRSLAKILFRKFFWTRSDLTAVLGIKGRVDTINGTSEAFFLPVISRPG